MVIQAHGFIEKLRYLVFIVAIVLGIHLYSTYGGNFSAQEFFFSTTPVLHVGEMPIRVEIADSSEERAQGLSGRESIGEGIDGLFFVFPETEYHAMWMKDMNFPIDIIWIGEDLTVVDIHERVTPDTYPRTFRSKKPARYALEVEEQFVETHNLGVGMTVRLPLGKKGGMEGT